MPDENEIASLDSDAFSLILHVPRATGTNKMAETDHWSSVRRRLLLDCNSESWDRQRLRA